MIDGMVLREAELEVDKERETASMNGYVGRER